MIKHEAGKNKTTKEKRLNTIFNVAIILALIVIVINVTYTIMIKQGLKKNLGLVFDMENWNRSDADFENIIEENGWTEEEPADINVKNIRNWMHTNISYPSDPSLYDDAYETVEHGCGNCLGQAHLCYELLNRLGVDVRLMTFINNYNTGHAVNVIRDRDRYYILDTTINYYGLATSYFKKFKTQDIQYDLSDYWEAELGIE